MRSPAHRGIFCTGASVIVLALNGACGDEVDSRAELGCAAQSLVYGEDDRKEPWQVGPLYRELAERFAVAVVDRAIAENLASGRIGTPALGARGVLQLCPDERFADQPAVAICSGVMLAPDLVMTAAHCVDGAEDCADLVYMVGLQNRADAPFSGVPAQTRSCERVEWQESDPSALGTARDIALVRLAAGFDDAGLPLSIREDGPRIGERVVTAGYPSGLPLKLDDGGQVRSAGEGPSDYATADIDAFAGSSGGPVFDARGALLGIVLGGRPDYSYDAANDCRRTVRVEAGATEAERMAPIAPVLERLCEAGIACELHARADARAPADAACADDAL